MPTYIYDPADTHRNHPLHVPGSPPIIVRAGETFEAGGLSALGRHLARVPGKTLGGVVRPCIVPLAEAEAPATAPVLAPPPADADELDNAVANLRWLAPGKVQEAAWALAALVDGSEFHINPKHISMVAAEPVHVAPPVVALDPVVLPPPAVVDVTLSPRTYTADALADMTRNDLLAVAENAGVAVPARAARVKADIIVVLAEAGLVEG